MNSFYWLGNLAAWSTQAAILVAVGGAAAWMFRLRAPRVRLAYAQALLAICLLLPAVEPWRAVGDVQIDFTTRAVRPYSPDRAPARSLPWRQALLIVLAAGCAARAAWLAVGFGKLHRWRHNSRLFAPLPAHLECVRAAVAPAAEFLLSSSISGPVTFGWRRPVVVLPRRFEELSADAQEAIACHELLHVRRRDWIVTVAEESIRAALWFHPAVWWLIGQIQLAREQAVDAEVVTFTRNRAQYLNALLAMAGSQPAMDLAPATLFLRKRHLANRVALLLKEGTMSKRTLISFCATSCGLLLAAGWLALHTFPLQAMPVPQEQTDSNLLHSVAPKYPQAARDKHIEGPVVMEVKIDEAGHVSDARVLSGPDELRSAALEAVLQWHYSPKAMSLPATTRVTMDFKLPKDGAPQAAAETSRPMPALPAGAHVTLSTLDVRGLTAAAHDELIERLPSHSGDLVDTDALKALTAAVHAFDEHLVISAELTGDPPRSVAVHVSLPGAAESARSMPPNRIRIGGNLQQTKLISQARPVYPPDAKAQRIQGVVKLQAVIGKDGKVENLQVLEGDPILAKAALEAVQQWQYQTTLLNGDPVEVLTEIDVNFTLAY